MRQSGKVICAVLLVSALPVMAQYVEGPGEAPSPVAGLTPGAVAEIQKGTEMTPAMRAAQNALSENAVGKLVVDGKKKQDDDKLFTHVIKKPGSITNQAQSGRCWLFAGLNLLRPAVIENHKLKNFELSQAYEQYWDKLERANRSLELAIALRNEPPDSRKNELLLKHPIEDGGDWNYVLYLVDKYGVVPKSVMPDTYSAAHTNEMNDLLSTVIRKGIVSLRAKAGEGATLEQLRAAKLDVLKQVNRILVLCLGEPPQTFSWRYEDKDGKVSAAKTYTPHEFYKAFVGVNLHDYMHFVNYPGKPMNAVLRFAWNRDTADGPDMLAVNVPIDVMKTMAMKSVLGDEAVWFCCNSGVQRDNETGLWDQGIKDYGDLFGLDFHMDKGDQLAFFEGAPDHCMVFVGVDVRNGKPDKWKVENSWGKKHGREGYWTITDSWFSANVYEMLVNKKYVPADVLKLADGKPHIMPPWDPFSN